jgi:hypothetical protein
MRPLRTIPIALLAGFVLLACDDDDPAGPQQPDVSAFAGAWTSTQVQYTSKEAPTQRFLNLHALPGYPGLTMQITPVAGSTTNATFTGNFPFPGEAGYQNVPLNGTIVVQSATEASIAFTWPPPLDLAPPITDFVAVYNLSGNSLTFTRQTAMFEFPGFGLGEEEATLVIAMTKS